ncbi:protein translocase subunit SecA [Sphaerisporangium melleum]|uniref:Protein translocase subunit SecA n=1 Tax=Sphaerisporangium melleum TaxID=321316 RepID=A0A917QYQ7_9ACTN|nr:accessory Sec system translocase SecA2 [Sphaerisporangium melleum]GGK75601.1 protein translocase subunit SecA [Sphaerisporangium melleum]GII72648.1 protein translocase subunit SecA [Sphaerisporangium melleum]
MRNLLDRPGSANIGAYRRLAAQADGHEERIRALTELPRPRMDDLAEFCAIAREAAHRTLDMRPFDVQLVGALALLNGQVAEMATGEGKTLSGAIAAAGYALRGRRVHVMSVNDYLARRDAEWMGPLYEALGVSVGWIGQSSTREERREAYAKDVTYAPVSEIGFDVLRDRVATSPADLVVPEPSVALIDEADSVLVDEARVPLVLAGAADPGVDAPEAAVLVRRLSRGYHYELDDQGRNVFLTAKGTDAVEKALGGINLYESLDVLTQVNLALHAHALLTRDVDYLVRDGRIHLVNQSRGRVATLQRWPDGLQAAVEAKEALPASETGEILDSITIQGLIRRYPQICGMTGTAVAVEEQLREFYELKVAVIPSNKPCVRVDEPDRVYRTMADKERALAEEITRVHATGRPILVGTLDVSESERLADDLKAAGLDCVVLNAKNDAEEAAIIARAGERSAITVSTQMAGRGTDIRLGEGVAELGGLYVIGSGRHASSRLDDQLRGRAGRQGDPGGSVFLVSLEDALITQFAPEEPLPPAAGEDGLVRHKRAAYVVGHAQRVAEGTHLDIHRNTWRYTRLLERQRDLVLERRNKVLHGDAGAEALAAAAPERWAELTGEVGEAVLGEAARQIVLYHLDRCWTEHLGFMSDVREGIHLRALGHRLSPLDEFHREGVAAYRRLLEEVEKRSIEMFEGATITAEGLDALESGLKRPTATWTYLVQENPFGDAFDRALRRLSPRAKRRQDLDD